MLIGNSTAQGSTAYLSYYACESAAQGLPQCAVPITSLVFCANTACENCMAGSADETACLTEAENGVCSTITIPTECDPVVNADPASAQCDGTDFQGLYTNMANYMCGAP
jgi:hypothetical protein